MKPSTITAARIIIAIVSASAVAWQSPLASRASANDFLPSYEAMGTRLSLSGVGVLKYLGFVRIYNGALYLPADVEKNRALDDVPKRLEVSYLRSLKAEDFGPATIMGIGQNVGPATFKRLESRIAYHNTLYENMRPGDRVSLTYMPSIGTTVEVKGKTKGTIPGADFARAIFSMWLGEKPFDMGFKRALLGEK